MAGVGKKASSNKMKKDIEAMKAATKEAMKMSEGKKYGAEAMPAKGNGKATTKKKKMY